MKKVKILCLVMALVLVGGLFASCGTPVPTTKINCTVTVIANGETIIDNLAYAVEDTEKSPATVLKAVTDILFLQQIDYLTDDEQHSLISVTWDGVEYKNGLNGEEYFTWLYTVDGEEPDSGRAGTNPVLEGQTIVYEFVSID